MGLRPNSCYRDIQRSYTRLATRVQKKDFIGGVPGVKTRQFVMGNQTKDFDTQLDIVAKKSMQVRDNALEAVRLKLVRELNENVGKNNWTMKIRKFPFHILRENKAASGAGADRVSSGMKHSFGKNVGRAAQVKKGKILLSVVVNTPNVKIAQGILDKVRYKVNLPFTVDTHTHDNQKLSGRKKWTREAKIAKAKGISLEEAKKESDPKAAKKGEPAVKGAPVAKGAAAKPAAKTAGKKK